MAWHSVTLASGKSALVDFSKVMYISASAKGGASLHFQMVVENATGKPTPKTVTVREPVEAFVKSLKGRIFR